MAEVKTPGEDKAWELLRSHDPETLCRAASVGYDAGTKTYQVRSFGMDFSVSLGARTITSTAPDSDVLLTRLGYFFRLSVLWYLVHAKNVEPTGRLVKLQSLRGGDIFSKGSHILPLDQLAAKYGKDPKAFLARGAALGGLPEKLADAALSLSPLPRIPAVLTLWLEDEEFPARADLLFDSTCELQLPTDIIWSIAMMTVLVML